MKTIALLCLLLITPFSLKGVILSFESSSSRVIFSASLYAETKSNTTKLSKQTKICKPGFQGIVKWLMAIPFALAEFFMTFGAILHALFYLIGALLSVTIFLVVYLIFFLVAIASTKAMSIWEFGRYLFKHSIDWFDYLEKLNFWYNGNC